MAHSNDFGIGAMPFVAGAAIVANSFVKLDTTAGRVVACTEITHSPIGVAMTAASAAGEQVVVQLYGKAKLRLGDTVATVGVGICAAASSTGTGDAVAGLGATAYEAAYACESGVSGDVITVLLLGPRGKHPTL